MSVFHSLMREI